MPFASLHHYGKYHSIAHDIRNCCQVSELSKEVRQLRKANSALSEKIRLNEFKVAKRTKKIKLRLANAATRMGEEAAYTYIRTGCVARSYLRGVDPALGDCATQSMLRRHERLTSTILLMTTRKNVDFVTWRAHH